MMTRDEWWQGVAPVVVDQALAAMNHDPEILFEGPGGTVPDCDVAIVLLMGWDDEIVRAFMIDKPTSSQLSAWRVPTSLPVSVLCDPLAPVISPMTYTEYRPTNYQCRIRMRPDLMWQGCPIDEATFTTRIAVVRMRPVGWREDAA